MMNAEDRARKFGTHFQPDLDWLALAPPETLLEPDRPIIDTHHHLGEIKGAVNPILKGHSLRYLLDDYVADVASGHNIIASIYVEGHSAWRRGGPRAFRPVGEIEFANGIAAMSASGQYGSARVAAGIVGHVDLTMGSTTVAVLEAAIAAGNGRLRGIRHGGHWDADPGVRNSMDSSGGGLLGSPAFIEGAREVARRGLTVEAWVYYPQLDDVCVLADALPDSRIVLNHMGGPLGLGSHAQRPDEVFETWRRLMAKVAKRENVTVKISGLTNRLTNYMGRAIPPDSTVLAQDWHRYIATTIEWFGSGRCMFASSFPVDKQGASWNAHWNAYKRIVAEASDDEKTAMFSGTASRIYDLDLQMLQSC